MLPSDISATDFGAQFSNADKSLSPQLSELKNLAFQNFKNSGFPTTKNEEWKYTNVAPLLKNNFKEAGKTFVLSKKDISNFLPADENEIYLVFENGKFNLALSNISSLPNGMTVGNISNFSDHPAVKNHLGKIASFKNESFVALNTALFQNGAFVFADEKISCPQTIHLLFINDARSAATVSYPRNLIVAAAGSSFSVSENYYSVDAVHPSFCNPVTELYIGENASLQFCKNESENSNDFHIDHTSAFLRKNSTLNIHTITSGGKMVRNNIRIELQDQNGSAYLNGLYLTSGESHVDNHSVVDHSSPDCYSNEFYKGILGGKSQGVFNGKIFVRKDAQKTNAYQSNKNIILSDDASMNAKPQLEIYADDVKCSHGATTGQLDQEAMFYLRSRGIGANEASALLTNAFAEEILNKITIDSVRENLKTIIHSKLMKVND